MSRFFVVENPLKMKLIRETVVERDGKNIRPFRYWPSGDYASTKAVVIQIKKWIKYSEARDRVWEKHKECPTKLKEKIEELEEWLESWGYLCMQDVPADFNKVIRDNFWELF